MTRRSSDTRCRARLLRMYQRLLDHFGPQHWWPGDTAVEIMAGAVLTQNTNWQNVEGAVANLKDADVLSVAALAGMRGNRLSALIRPAGYFRVKARRLKNLFRWVQDEFAGSTNQMGETAPAELRERMLSEVSGVGPETVDSILLYALGHPVFVVDAYTRRVLCRHGMKQAGKARYEAIREFFEDNLPADPALYNEFHALFVAVGKAFCKPSNSACGECPLEGFSLRGCRLASAGTGRGRGTRRRRRRKQR